MLAPVIVFAYNRKKHLQQVLDALEHSDLSEQSCLYVFSDGPKREKNIQEVQEVRYFLQEYQKKSNFQEVTIIEAPHNKGLAKSIIEGVTNIINEYGKAIIVEDDTIVAPYFLKYMNEALDFYREKQNIFSIGGLALPMDLPKGYKFDIIKTQRVTSMCWATWKDRWNTIDWSMPDYKKFRFNIKARKQFNRWGMDRSNMLDDQMNGRINSWAIRFDYHMWKLGTYNIIPKKTLVNNAGFDGTGTHFDEKRYVEGASRRFNAGMWYECEAIRFEDVPYLEFIRMEYIKHYGTNRVLNYKRFWGNVWYSMKRRKVDI